MPKNETSSAACQMARAFDRVFVVFLDSPEHRLRSGDHFFDQSASSCRLDRDKASRYASSSMRAGAVDEWFKASRLPRKKDLQLALSLNASMLSRAHAEKPLEPVVTERMFRQADLLVRATEVFGEDGPTWMATPHPLLDGKAPAEFATNEFGGEKVRSILNAIEYGGVV
jgi:putative toxin-antitoxin system antitoxin component (TIGR02293 family)